METSTYRWTEKEKGVVQSIGHFVPILSELNMKFKTYSIVLWLAVFCYLTAPINVYADSSSLLYF